MGISIGLVGLGSFGSNFADLFMAHPLVDRIALCDREPDRIAAFASKPSWQGKFDPGDAYATLDDICASDLDALVIITQPWLHAPQCIQALQSGKHVYSAVPIIELPDGNEILDWCDKLVRAVRDTGLHYMMGETTYYRPEAMFCRRQAAAGAFGDFVYSEGEYLHDVDHPRSNLRTVMRNRMASQIGQQWPARLQEYRERGSWGGPMHYPTHSTSGPISVMGAHALQVSAWGYANRSGDPYYDEHLHRFSNEVALYRMSNGATMRIAECREIGMPGRETFRLYGTQASFENGCWLDKESSREPDMDEMRDPLPVEVADAFRSVHGNGLYGGHGGSHAYLVHEFVDAIAHDRVPTVNIWEAVRYMAAGAMAHQSALRDGELLTVPDWGDAPTS